MADAGNCRGIHTKGRKVKSNNVLSNMYHVLGGFFVGCEVISHYQALVVTVRQQKQLKNSNTVTVSTIIMIVIVIIN